MATQIYGKIHFDDINGVPLSGGKVYVYEPGTTTDKASYTTPASSVANTQPVVLDSRGEGNIYVIGDCKIVVNDALGNLIYTLDNVKDLSSDVLALLAASSGSSLVGFIQSGTGAFPTTVQSKLRERISVKDFGAVGDGVTDDTSAIQHTVNYVFGHASVGSLNQLGGIVYFPAGRYRVTSTITGITDGIVIQGEPSGLDSVPLAQASSGSQIFCDSSVAAFPMFTVTDGGPITVQDIGLNGTQTVTNSVCIKSGDGTTNVGATQAHFSNVRFTGFSSVFSAAKLADASFYDCGFEANSLCFNLVGGTYTSLGGLKFVSCIFFGGASGIFSVISGAHLDNVTFASCIFTYDAAQTVNCDVFQVYDATLSNISFASCNFQGYPNDNCIRTLSTTSAVTGILFSACNFKTTNAIFIPNNAPIGASYDIALNGCLFNDSNITADYELVGFTLVGNIFRGTSLVSLTECNNLIITGNNFVNCSVNPPLVLNGVFTRVEINNNIFNDSVTSIALNNTSTKIRISDNINGSVTVKFTWTTVTAGSGGWTNHAKTPQFYKDNEGFIVFRGVVSNAAPGAYSIMCSTPTGFRPDVDQTFIVPDISGLGYITCVHSTDGSVYSISKVGTGTDYDLSTIRSRSA